MALSEADQIFLDQAFNTLLTEVGLPNGLSFSLSASLVAAENAVTNKYSFAQDVIFEVNPDTYGTGLTYTIKGKEGATGNSLVIAGGDGQVFISDTGGNVTIRGGGSAVIPGNVNIQGSGDHPLAIYGNVNLGQINTANVDIGGPSLLLRSQSVALSLEDWSETPGDVPDATSVSGLAAIALGTSSVTISNPSINAGAIAFAWVQQSAADLTLIQIVRTSVTSGSFTIYGNANATADVIVGWIFINPTNVWEPPP